jgi:hypothetical protein
MGVQTPRSRRRGRNAVFLIILLAAVANTLMAARYFTYREETGRLRAGMTKAQRERTDAVVTAERHRLRVEWELHLSINVDSSRMILERDGIVLRDMHVRLGPERFRGATGDTSISVQPLGQRTVQRVLGEGDSWEVPRTVFDERGIPVPESRRLPGALGANAIVLSEGTVIYAVPESGPLADSTYVLPGSVVMDPADLKALSASIRPGMSVYFYR